MRFDRGMRTQEITFGDMREMGVRGERPFADPKPPPKRIAVHRDREIARRWI